jgi:hypothetical protein
MCYDILREEENNSAYPYSLIDTLLNWVQKAVCSWLYVNPLNKEEVRKGQLPFLNREVFYETALTQYVWAEALPWATEIEINTQTRPDAWVCYIGGNIVEYREKDDNHLLQCTWINGKIKGWEQASLIYEIPTDFMSPINLILDDRVQIKNEWYDDVFSTIRDNKWKWDYRFNQWRGYDYPFYVIKDDKYLILYNFNTSWQQLRLRYERKPDYMINPEDECVIPDDTYAMNVIPYLAVWETMYNRWEEQRGAEVINWWMTKLKEMYKYFNKTGIERYTGQHYWMWKYKFNI